MNMISANPETLHEILSQVQAGDKVGLEPGTYSRRIKISDRRGASSKPIIIRGAPGVVFDGGRSADAYREEGNRCSLEVQQSGRFPGLWPFITEAMITVERCSDVILEDFAIRRCWPMAILVKDSQSTTIRRLAMEESTFAIAALGATTYGITVDEVTWSQKRCLRKRVMFPRPRMITRLFSDTINGLPRVKLTTSSCSPIPRERRSFWVLAAV